MRVGLDKPERVFVRRVLVARHLLLLKAPVGELDLMREQVAAGQDVAQTELAAERAQAVARLPVPPAARLGDNFDDKVVVGVAGKAELSAWVQFARGLTQGNHNPRPRSGNRPR